MSGWHYVVSRERNEHGEFYQIREYYELIDGEGDVEHLWTQDAIESYGESLDDLRVDLLRMVEALTRDEVLDLTLDAPRLVKRSEL